MNEIKQKEKTKANTHSKQTNKYIYTFPNLEKTKITAYLIPPYIGTGDTPTEPKACLSVQVRNFLFFKKIN